MNTEAKRKALIVGISHYTKLEELDFCKKDAEKMYELLESLGYEISENNKLIGKVEGQKVRDKIHDFFGDTYINPDDTLLFYYSGHGVPDVDGIYLASSDIDPDKPYRRGFSFEELSKMAEKSISTRVVVILDCCNSGDAKLISKGMSTIKGDQDNAAKIGRTAIDEKSRKLPLGQGKYILSASQAAQEAYALETGEHSIFTYYLLEGLRGNAESVDSEGNVTPQSLGKYVYRAIMSLPVDKRPRQKPITRAEESGDVILASHPELKPGTKKGVTPVLLPTDVSSSGGRRKYQFLVGRNRYRLLLPIVAAAITGIIVLVPASVLHPYHGNNITSIIYNAGSNNGSQTAMADMQSGRLFNPACDPTGAHASGGQHPTSYCTGWTNGYISAWNAKHPGWTNGYISAWKPNNPPANGSILSCQQCGTKLKPIIRYINGSNDGGQAALSNIQNGNPFNPACDPTRSHTSDGLHTTEYCNGWTNGYTSAWNANHTSSPRHPSNSLPLIRSIGPGTNGSILHPAGPGSNATSPEKALPTLTHLNLICKNKSNDSLICTYTNGTYNHRPAKS